MTNNLRLLIGAILFLVAIAFGFYIVFSNIHMTRTELFIEYWKQWLIIGAFDIIAYLLVKRTIER